MGKRQGEGGSSLRRNTKGDKKKGERGKRKSTEAETRRGERKKQCACRQKKQRDEEEGKKKREGWRCVVVVAEGESESRAGRPGVDKKQ